MSNKQKSKMNARFLRQRRVRSVIQGTAERPRLHVFRSLRHVYAQLTDDAKGVTLVAASDKELSGVKGLTVETAQSVGTLLAKKAKDKGITQAVFDRSGYKYHGRIAALAQGAREGGLEF